MGMVVCLLTINEEKARSLLKDSSGMDEWLFSEDVQDSPDLLDLDKSWHGLHYLFTQSAWESDTLLGQVIMGGKPFGDDLGMVPTRMLMPENVKEISQALNGLTHENLKKNYNLANMSKQDIYPTIWDREEEVDETFTDYLLPNFEALKEHYNKAAKTNKAIILSLS